MRGLPGSGKSHVAKLIRVSEARYVLLRLCNITIFMESDNVVLQKYFLISICITLLTKTIEI